MAVDTKVRTKFAVIPSNGRPCLADCIAAIQPQVDRVIIIDTNPDTQKPGIPFRSEEVERWYAEEDAVNISAWWNQGLERALYLAEQNTATPEWHVALLNDDAIVPQGWFDIVVSAMRRGGAVAGCMGPHDVDLRVPEQVPLDYRLTGYAFILDGKTGLRANEDLHWYFTDDYIDWESRKLGGMTMVRDVGEPVIHLHPNAQMTPELQVQVAKDAGTFMSLYGKMPW